MNNVTSEESPRSLQNYLAIQAPTMPASFFEKVKKESPDISEHQAVIRWATYYSDNVLDQRLKRLVATEGVSKLSSKETLITSHAQFVKENLLDGERYAGLVIGKEGEANYLLFLMAAKPETRLTFEAATIWAEALGSSLPSLASVVSSLPTRQEQPILYANIGEEFSHVAYWSSTPADFTGHAWSQNFETGAQHHFKTSTEYLARAVRRVYL